MNDNYAVLPSWTQVYTIAEAEEQLKDFKFKGPGWYKKGEDTLLVLPNDPKGTTYLFAVYNYRDARVSFQNIAALPVRNN